MSNTARQLLEALKATQVRQLAFLAGLDSSATKTQLVDRLPHLLSVPRLPHVTHKDKKTLRVLSIDMGIRNLAYCVLDVPVSAFAGRKDNRDAKSAATITPSPSTSKKKESSIDVFSTCIPSPSPTTAPSILHSLTLSAWQRTSINPESLNLPSQLLLTISHAPSTSTPKTPPPPPPPSTEAFDPPLFARLAYALVRHTLLPHTPDVILIERQRYRSAGSPAILEWTVRVNMFESMLHSVLETLRSEQRRSCAGGRDEGFPDVWPVNPKKVTGFWASGGEVEGGDLSVTATTGQEKGKRVVRKAKEMKEVKIAIAERWLVGTAGGGGGLKCAAVARGTRGSFLDARGRKKGRGGGGGAAVFDDGDVDLVEDDVEELNTGVEAQAGEEDDGDVNVGDVVPDRQSGGNTKDKKAAKLSKLDDLADCLLQGVAWMQWEVNRRRILEVLRQKGQEDDAGSEET